MPKADSDSDLQQVIDAELPLLQPATRHSAPQLEALLHEEFVEFGASGRRWERAEVIRALLAEPSAGQLPSASEIVAHRLDRDVALITYLSEVGNRRARRSTVWRRTPAGWQLYFHQGALVQPGS